MNPADKRLPTLVGLVGRSGSGKDTVGKMIKDSNEAWIRFGFAGALKAICRAAFDFSDEQLFGPSEKRNESDKRYPREHGPLDAGSDLVLFCECCGATAQGGVAGDEFTTQCYLTPRFALQRLGTEFGRACYPNVWVEMGIRQALEQIGHGRRVVFTDVRFINEAKAIREAGGEVWRIYRPSADEVVATHESEQEMDTRATNALCTRFIHNDGSLDDLQWLVAGMLK